MFGTSTHILVIFYLVIIFVRPTLACTNCQGPGAGALPVLESEGDASELETGACSESGTCGSAEGSCSACSSNRGCPTCGTGSSGTQRDPEENQGNGNNLVSVMGPDGIMRQMTPQQFQQYQQQLERARRKQQQQQQLAQSMERARGGGGAGGGSGGGGRGGGGGGGSGGGGGGGGGNNVKPLALSDFGQVPKFDQGLQQLQQLVAQSQQSEANSSKMFQDLQKNSQDFYSKFNSDFNVEDIPSFSDLLSQTIAELNKIPLPGPVQQQLLTNANPVETPIFGRVPLRVPAGRGLVAGTSNSRTQVRALTIKQPKRNILSSPDPDTDSAKAGRPLAKTHSR